MKYLDQYRALHRAAPSFGASASVYMPEIRLVIDYLKPKTVLDFGCGKAILIKELARLYPHIEFFGYDPAIPGRDTLPIEKADLVINTDVLEHIPEDELSNVVAKIASISDNLFVVLHHALARQILPNGENAHCTIKPPQWYYALLSKHYRTPYPLPGRELWLSALITFSPDGGFLNTYHRIVSPPVKPASCPAISTKRGILLPRWLGLLIACFIPKTKNRKHFRAKYVKDKK